MHRQPLYLYPGCQRVTSSATVKLQSKWEICVSNMKLHLKAWNIRSEMLLTILLGNPYIFTRLFTWWSLADVFGLIARQVFKYVTPIYIKRLIRRPILCDYMHLGAKNGTATQKVIYLKYKLEVLLHMRKSVNFFESEKVSAFPKLTVSLKIKNETNQKTNK